MESDKKVAIIVLNWNNADDTIECLESLKKIDDPNHEIILVDNGSTDNSVAKIRERFPNITIIENKTNLGFAEGNNIGMKYALQHGAHYLFLLNNDTIVDKNILKVFREYMDNHPEVGVAGAKIYYYDNRKVIWHAGAEFVPSKAFYCHLGINDIDRPEYNKVRECSYVTGCAFFIRGSIISKIGYLDKRLFLYTEDADFCL